MQKQVYQQIYEAEKTHWWFVGRRNIIRTALDKHIPHKVDEALDVGCGTGLNALIMKSFARKVTGLDPSGEAVRFSHMRAPDLSVIQEAFPYTELKGQYDLVTLFDVLEHIEDDSLSLQKVEKLLRPGGVAVLTVPAFPFLWSDHDKVLQHYRRYTMSTLKNVITKNTKLRIIDCNYFNTLFFLPILIFRVIRKIFHILPDRADDFMVSDTINKLCLSIFNMEGKFVQKVKYPFGVSIICVLQKSVLSGKDGG